MAEVAISKEIFSEILSRISRLRCCSQQWVAFKYGQMDRYLWSL